MSTIGFGGGPSPLVSSIGSRQLRLCGDFVVMLHPVRILPRDAVIVRLELIVLTPPTTRLLPLDTYWYPPVELPLARLPELRQLIDLSFSGYSQSVFAGGGGDDHDVINTLTELVTIYVTDRMEGRFPPPENTLAMYRIRAYLTSPGVPEEAAPALILRKLRMVTYRMNEKEFNAEDEAAEMLTETICPICLQDFEEGEEVHLTPCRHPFHPWCLERCLQLKTECPLCRTSMQ